MAVIKARARQAISRLTHCSSHTPRLITLPRSLHTQAQANNMEGITTNGASHGSGDSNGAAKQKEGGEAAAGTMKDDSIIMKGDAGAKAKDFAEYFCSYAYLYHQVRRARM